MENSLGRIRRRGFVAALTVTAVLAFGMLGGIAPANAVGGTDPVPAPATGAVSTESTAADADASVGAIAGTLRQNIDGTVSAVSNGQVVVYSAGTGSYVGSVSTDSAGEYVVTSLAAGDYKLEFRGAVADSTEAFAGQLASVYYGGSTDFSSATVIAVGAAQMVSGIDATLVLGGQISGTVTQSAGGAISVLDSVWVEVFEAGSGESVSGTNLDQAGNYTVRGLHAGSYKVLVSTSRSSRPGLVFQYYADASDLASAKTITLGVAESVTGIDVVLTGGGTIGGTVTKLIDGTITPAVGVQVLIYTASGGDVVNGGATDAQGNYQIGSLAAGSYKVGFEIYGTSSGLASEYFGGGHDLAASSTVTLQAGASVTGIDAELEPAGAAPPASTPTPTPPPAPTATPVGTNEAGVKTGPTSLQVAAKTATTPVLADTGMDVSAGWVALVFLLLGGLAVTVGARTRTKPERMFN